MFELLIVKPIFNLLVLIYALIPGHNFGLSIILFTIIVRLLMWPVIKKQLHHAKAMRALQPELKKIKKAAKGNRQQESMMMMALYKEKEVSPFGSIGVLIVQIIVLLGLYRGLSRVIADPRAIIDHAYGSLQNLSWMQTLATDISKFDATLFGIVDLKRAALGPGGWYFAGFVLVVGSVIAQFYQTKQLMPTSSESKSLRQLLRDASKSGKSADTGDVQAATNRSMRYLLPGIIFIVSIRLASALSLYWLVGGVAAYIQQSRVLGQDKEELLAATPKSEPIEGEVVKVTTKKPKKSSKKSPAKKRKK